MQKKSVSGIIILGLLFFLAGTLFNMLSPDYVFIGITLIIVATGINVFALFVAIKKYFK